MMTIPSFGQRSRGLYDHTGRATRLSPQFPARIDDATGRLFRDASAGYRVGTNMLFLAKAAGTIEEGANGLQAEVFQGNWPLLR